MSSERVLEVFRDGKRFQPLTTEPLLPGSQGNIQALAWMAKIVREDRTQLDLRNFVTREIIADVSGFDEETEIRKCFEFARDRIRYRQDPVKTERIADLWSCLYALNPDEPEGDCSIKSVALATCLALIGFKPFFIVIRQNPLSTSFNHVYVGLERHNRIVPLDPTPEDEPIGYEADSLERKMYRIFD